MVKSSKPKPPRPPKPSRPPKRKRPPKKPQTSFTLSLPAVQLPETAGNKPEKPTRGDLEAARARVLRVLAEDIEEQSEKGTGDP
jgi:hypothetical protein